MRKELGLPTAIMGTGFLHECQPPISGELGVERRTRLTGMNPSPGKLITRPAKSPRYKRTRIILDRDCEKVCVLGIESQLALRLLRKGRAEG
jgi:hypothetical protein